MKPEVEFSDCMCLSIRKASRNITQAYNDEFKGLGINITQFSVLAILAGTGKQTITKVAHQLGSERTTVTRAIVILEKKKLINIVLGADKRERLIAISKKGIEILDLARPHWKSAQLKIEHLLTNQIDNLRSNLGRLHHL
jgi:DNA-binding MarR family transcriptional regulator